MSLTGSDGVYCVQRRLSGHRARDIAVNAHSGEKWMMKELALSELARSPQRPDATGDGLEERFIHESAHKRPVHARRDEIRRRCPRLRAQFDSIVGDGSAAAGIGVASSASVTSDVEA